MAKNKKIEEKAEAETKKSIVLDCDKKDIKDKKQALKDLVKSIEKDFGKGSIMKLGDMPAVNIDCIPTGILSLDLALGGNGIPRGRILEIYGEPSTGKSSLALNIIKQAQNIGGQAAYVDVENAMDSEYAKKIGVDVDNLLLSQPDTGEQALEIVEKVVRSGIVDFVVVDSVAALVPKAEIEGSMGDSHMALQARLMSQAMRKLTSIINKTKCSVLFINQTRTKVGIVYGNPTTTSGGNALKFYASVRMEIKKSDVIKKGEEMIGNKVLVKVVKNKIAPPFREARFDIIFGKGMPKESPIVDSAVEYGVVEKSGSWYNYKGTKIGQGKDQVVEYLKNNAKICDEIELAVRDKYKEKNNGVVVVNTNEEVDEDGVFITGVEDEVNVKGNEEA
jgi:recombination protein RecA